MARSSRAFSERLPEVHKHVSARPRGDPGSEPRTGCSQGPGQRGSAWATHSSREPPRPASPVLGSEGLRVVGAPTLRSEMVAGGPAAPGLVLCRGGAVTPHGPGPVSVHTACSG